MGLGSNKDSQGGKRASKGTQDSYSADRLALNNKLSCLCKCKSEGCSAVVEDCTGTACKLIRIGNPDSGRWG